MAFSLLGPPVYYTLGAAAGYSRRHVCHTVTLGVHQSRQPTMASSFAQPTPPPPPLARLASPPRRQRVGRCPAGNC